jgi:protein-S-isoprenylcysteine O-methyltransferase Ste14
VTVTDSVHGDAPPRSPIERQVNVGLLTVLVVSALLVVYGVAYIVNAWDGDSGRSRFEALEVGLVFLMLPGAVVFFTARSARRRLRTQAVSARLWSILTGIFTMLAALPLLTNVIGLAAVITGLFTLTAALLLKREQRE